MARRILIIDGHSVIFAWPELRRLHDQRSLSAREAIVRLMTEYQDATEEHVVVVFDGKSSKTTQEMIPGGIQVFYSKAGQTADEIIERLVAKYANSRDITVATADMMEQQTVISFGALAVTPDTLRTWLEEARGDLKRRLEAFRPGRS